jgi:hypothetical protein
MVRILYHEEKGLLRLPLPVAGGGGCAYLKGQRLYLLKVVCASICTCILKMACFLETINWNQRVAMLLYRRAYIFVSEAKNTFEELVP